MSQYTELEELKAVVATQDLLAFESVEIAECLGNEFDKTAANFQKPTTVKEIEQRERDKLQRKLDQVPRGRSTSIKPGLNKDVETTVSFKFS